MSVAFAKHKPSVAVSHPPPSPSRAQWMMEVINTTQLDDAKINLSPHTTYDSMLGVCCQWEFRICHHLPVHWHNHVNVSSSSAKSSHQSKSSCSTMTELCELSPANWANKDTRHHTQSSSLSIPSVQLSWATTTVAKIEELWVYCTAVND